MGTRHAVLDRTARASYYHGGLKQNSDMRSDNSHLKPHRVLPAPKRLLPLVVIAFMFLLAPVIGGPAEAQEEAVITRVVAGTIGLDAPVEPVNWGEEQSGGGTRRVWNLPLNAAGWYEDSTLPGQGGNVVLLGHHNQGADSGLSIKNRRYL